MMSINASPADLVLIEEKIILDLERLKKLNKQQQAKDEWYLCNPNRSWTAKELAEYTKRQLCRTAVERKHREN